MPATTEASICVCKSQFFQVIQLMNNFVRVLKISVIQSDIQALPIVENASNNDNNNDNKFYYESSQ